MFARVCILYLFVSIISCGERNDRSYFKNADSQAEETSESSENSSSDGDENYPDDTYCATVEYFNPNTGTQSSYTLTVDVESNEVVLINFPNGGVLDQSHFSGAELDDKGRTSFTSDKGYEYEVEISGNSGDCFDDTPRVVRCNGKTKKGRQCKNVTDNANGLCWRHQDQE